MKKEFIPYQLALELKQLGFDEPCIATIDQTGFIHIKGTERPTRGAMFYDEVDTPLFQQAFRWFREKHLLDGLILPQTYSSLDPLPIYFLAIESYKDSIWTEPFNSTSPQTLLHYSEYEEAELACLTRLIKIVKSNINEK